MPLRNVAMTQQDEFLQGPAYLVLGRKAIVSVILSYVLAISVIVLLHQLGAMANILAFVTWVALNIISVIYSIRSLKNGFSFQPSYRCYKCITYFVFYAAFISLSVLRDKLKQG